MKVCDKSRRVWVWNQSTTCTVSLFGTTLAIRLCSCHIFSPQHKSNWYRSFLSEIIPHLTFFQLTVIQNCLIGESLNESALKYDAHAKNFQVDHKNKLRIDAIYSLLLWVHSSCGNYQPINERPPQ